MIEVNRINAYGKNVLDSFERDVFFPLSPPIPAMCSIHFLIFLIQVKLERVLWQLQAQALLVIRKPI